MIKYKEFVLCFLLINSFIGGEEFLAVEPYSEQKADILSHFSQLLSNVVDKNVDKIKQIQKIVLRDDSPSEDVDWKQSLVPKVPRKTLVLLYKPPVFEFDSRALLNNYYYKKQKQIDKKVPGRRKNREFRRRGKTGLRARALKHNCLDTCKFVLRKICKEYVCDTAIKTKIVKHFKLYCSREFDYSVETF